MDRTIAAAAGVTIIFLTGVTIVQQRDYRKLMKKHNNVKEFVKIADRIIEELVEQIPGDDVRMPTQLLTDMKAWTILSRNGL